MPHAKCPALQCSETVDRLVISNLVKSYRQPYADASLVRITLVIYEILNYKFTDCIYRLINALTRAFGTNLAVTLAEH